MCASPCSRKKWSSGPRPSSRQPLQTSGELEIAIRYWLYSARMSSKEIHIHIQFKLKSLLVIALCAVVLVSVVVTPTIVEAAKKSSVLCLSTKGTLVKRSGCRKSETRVAAGVYTTANLPTVELGAGVNKMSLNSAVTSHGARIANSVNDLSGRQLTAESLFSASLQTVTTKYAVPAGWSGSLEAACPETAPIPVSWGGYSPEWQPLLDAKKVRFQIAPVSFALGSRAQISGGVGFVTDAGVGNDPAITGRSVKDPCTLFVSQVCAPAVQLEAATG